MFNEDQWVADCARFSSCREGIEFMKRTRARAGIDCGLAQLASAFENRIVVDRVDGARMKIARAVRRHLKPALGGIAALLMFSCSDEDAANTAPPAQGAPRTIYDVLELINELPHPVQLPDFLESLERPLALNANFNTQSAQPALGKNNPRIFIIMGKSFSMSLVPGAEPTLEFGERDASTLRSVKGELHFPVEGQLAPEDAFVRLAPDDSTGLTLDQGTLCGTCHNNEAPAPDYPFRGAFASDILKPTPFFAVDVGAIRRERDACDSALEPERCSVLEAIFDHGDVVQTAFL
jgi:hypothetical protein